jgi:2-methylcitrate dehydratase PrpD
MTKSLTHTRDLVEFLASLSIDRLPPGAIDAAKWCLLDTLGCMLFGAPEPWSRIMAEEMLAEGSKGVASIVGRKELVTAPAAALCNGTAAHGFELDDHLDEAIVHPGAIVVSAALAAAEAADASGERLLLGLIAGYEMLDRLGRSMGTRPSQHGWHKTAVAGPVGAAVAASVVMNLDADAVQRAVGLACAASSGTKAFAAGEGGGMEKRMHAGRAAEAGVRMAQLAARGFTAPPGAIEGRFGLLHVMSGDSAKPALLTAGLGLHWAVEHVYVKLYPCCAWIQAAAQQLVELRGPRPLTNGQIARVQVGVSAYALAQNGGRAPQDTFGAQFSIPYCAALALTGDPADAAAYAPDTAEARTCMELAQRVELVVDPEMEAAYPKHYGARVELELATGEKKVSSRLDPHGMPADPCTPRELTQKFESLASRVKSREDVAAITSIARNAERLRSARELAALLRA